MFKCIVFSFLAAGNIYEGVHHFQAGTPWWPNALVLIICISYIYANFPKKKDPYLEDC